MFCKKCGGEISENAVMCPNCQESTLPNGGQAAPPTYLAQSIIVTVLCCMPLGIPAIVYAAQVNSKFALGDYAGSVAASKKAKMWSWISFGVGLVTIASYILLNIFIGLAAAAAQK